MDTDLSVITREPFAATWMQREDRSPEVRLEANENYWDAERGPKLREVVFRNDVSHECAVELVTTTEGEVDIVTMVSPGDAGRIEDSEYADLVVCDAIYAVAGVIDRGAVGLPLDDHRARRALNLAVDRAGLIEGALGGYGSPLSGLVPDAALPEGNPLDPYPHDPERAASLWRDATGGAESRPLRLGALREYGTVAERVADDLRGALGVEVEVVVFEHSEESGVRRRLAEKQLPQGWDVLLIGHGAQEADGVALELHRGYVAESGEFRAGPRVEGFENLYAGLVAETDPAAQVEMTARIDRYVYDEALALFLYAPQSLYAVNRHVDFVPYRTSFELADTSVGEGHWSLGRNG